MDIAYKEVNRDQDCFLPSNILDLLDPKDIVFTVIKVVESIDTSQFDRKYSNLGQNAFHPKMMLQILFYAFTQGIFSSRKIEQLLRYDVRYMYIAGNHRPSHNRLSQFRRENALELKDCFVKIVQHSMKLRLALLESVSIDGSKIAAAASDKKLKNRDRIAKEIESIVDHAQTIDEQEDHADDTSSAQTVQQQRRLNKLHDAQARLDADPNQTHINLTDLDCRVQHKVGSGYNLQLAVDQQYQIIVAQDVVSAPNDVQQLIPMIEQVEANTSTQGIPKQIIADAGYDSGHNFERLYQDKAHIDAYVATREYSNKTDHPPSKFDHSRFHIDIEHKTGTCPLGQPMLYHNREVRNGVMTFRFIGTACGTCPERTNCTKSDYRQVRVSAANVNVKAMTAKMQTDQGTQAMAERRQTVEPVFGQLKSNLGFSRFLRHGLSKVRGEFSILCAAFNIQKIHKYYTQDGVLDGSRGSVIASSFLVSILRPFWLQVRFYAHKCVHLVIKVAINGQKVRFAF